MTFVPCAAMIPSERAFGGAEPDQEGTIGALWGMLDKSVSEKGEG